MSEKTTRLNHFWMPAFLALCATQFGLAAIFGVSAGLNVSQAAMEAARSLGPRYYELLFVLALIGGLAALLARRTGAGRLCAFLAGIVPLWNFALHWAHALLIGHGPFGQYYTPRYSFTFFWGTLLPAMCVVLSAYAFSSISANRRSTQHA